MKLNVHRFSRSNQRRGAATLIFVLACCAVAMALVTVSLQVSLRQRRQLRTEHQLEQTRWVLDAALRKSIADPPEEASEVEIKPKLAKFDKASFRVSPNEEKKLISVQAKIGNETGTNVISRSASFEQSN